MAIAVLVVVFSPTVAYFFGVHDASLEASVTALRLSAIGYVPSAVCMLMLYFYMALGRKVLSSAISVLYGFAFPVAAAFAMVNAIGASGVWLSDPVSGVLTLGFILAAGRVISAREPGMPNDVALLPQRSPDELASLSTTSDADLETVFASAERELAGSGISAERARDIVCACSHAIRCVEPRAGGKPASIDVRILTDEAGAKIIVRDNGAAPDPHARADAPRSDSCNVTYEVKREQILGWNRLTVTIEEDGLGTA